MPNWCYNRATFMNEDPEQIKKVIAAAKKNELFDTLVPIGEWDYDVAIETWGTKWDARVEDIDAVSDTEVVLVFDTAWSPPIAFYNKMTELGFDIDAAFTEEAQQYAGIYQYGEEESMDLDFDKDSQKWIDEIENDDLKELVQEEYDRWKEWKEDSEEEEPVDELENK